MKRSGVDDPSFGTELSGRKLPPRRSEQMAEIDPATLPARSPEVGMDNELFKPPFLGTRVAKAFRSTTSLRTSTRPPSSATNGVTAPKPARVDADFKERIRAELRARLDEVKADGVLVPQVAWGYFPVNADGNDLVVFTDDERRSERMRFSFPRQREAPYLCIADFFRPVGLARHPTTPPFRS